MKNKRIKAMAIILSAGMALGMNGMLAKASDDNHSFSFSMKSSQTNSYNAAARYRQTSNPNNKWKVKLENNAEGAGTIAIFWIARADNKEAASDKHKVAQGSGAHYYNANNKGNQTDVQLAAKNNNNTSKSYKISGVWDEETN